MICCDRCEEWFHGDCVGITEARGRLMERNGEDYICPNCTAKKSQVVKPATTAPAGTAENGKSKGLAATTTNVAAVASKAEPMSSVATPSSSSLGGPEERTEGDHGIKGRIEKATNPSGKKKIKIFQPQALVKTADQKGLLKAEPNADKSSLPKCIGPGCERNAQPDSVYCGNDCILRHAAAAMKSITDVKEPKQKDKPKAQKTAGLRSAPKRSSTGGSKTLKKSAAKDEESDSDYDDDDEDDDMDQDEDDEDEHAEEHPPPPAASSWSSDHNYNAVTPEKTTPISPTVLNKTCMYLLKDGEKEQKKDEPAPVERKSASSTPVKGSKRSPGTKGAKTSPKGKKTTQLTGSAKSSKKQATPTSKKDKSKKSSPLPSPFPPGPVHITGALRVTKSSFTIPKKQPQQRESPSHSQSTSSKATSSVSSSRSQSSSSRPPHSTASAPPMSPTPPPNNQMRQNIRRSLTDILYKRASDSDDLTMTESEVGKLAVAIEKEMFNLCLSTDSKYKNKYRSLMFNLKDPKNKGLFYKVVWGELSPFRLVRLSAEELLSKEISEWRKPDTTEAQSLSGRTQSGQPKSGHRQESVPREVDMEEAPPSEGDVCISGTSSSPRMVSSAEQEELSFATLGSAQGSSAGGNSSMPDIFSTMLKDTTAEHRAHLFDLNCKICTGQRSEDEPMAKKAKVPKKPEVRQEIRSSRSSSGELPPVYQPSSEASPPEPMVYPESVSNLLPPSQTPAPAPVPAVSSVSITRRDPRMARHGSGVTVTHAVPEAPAVVPVLAEVPVAPLPAPVEVLPKGPLPMPPAPPPSMAVAKPAKTSTTEPPPEGETAIFLSGQEKIWKGFINMQAVAKFVTKAYLVSGSFEYLKEDLPDTIHVGGRISPTTVWDYVGKLKTSLSKELCLIRFHPATEEEEVAYVSLFSYFSSRKRFGVVANNNRRIKDLYLIPLSAKDPLPPKLLPFDGPGLEPARPNLLLGLVICQKDRKRAGASLEGEEKRAKIQIRDPDDTGLPKPTHSIKTVERGSRQGQDIPFSTTPPGSPAPLNPPEASSSSTAASVLSLLSSLKPSATSNPTGKDSPSSTSSAASSATTATPLQTILKTLFGKKKQDSEASNSPSDQGGEISVPAATILDPIVQQFGQKSKDKQIEEDEDDRPYDPEEEYDPGMAYSALKKSSDVAKETEVNRQPERTSNEVDDVAYDPEDDSMFEEVKVSQARATPEGLSEQQKMLEDINKQIEDQTRQLAEQEESIRLQSFTSITSTDALLTQPAKSILANSQLLQLGKKVEELVKSSSVAPLIGQRRDQRQSRDPRQAAASRRQTSDPEEKEEMSAPTSVPETAPSVQLNVEEPEVLHKVEKTEQDDPAFLEDSETTLSQEGMNTTTLPFLQSDSGGVSIPLLGEEMEPDMEVNYMEDSKEMNETAAPITTAETEMDKFSIWPNAASILKAGEVSNYEQNSEDSNSSSYFPPSTNSASSATSSIPVLTQSTTSGEPHSTHLPHNMSSSGYHSNYRPPTDIPQPAAYAPPQLGPPHMQRPPLRHVHPPISVHPPMQSPLPISGPPPMQVPPMPIQGAPMRGPPPMQGDRSQSQYGPPPGAYPPYQSQWGGSQHQQPHPPGPPQNIMPPRGPPPPFPPMGQRGPPMFDPSVPPHIPQQGPPPRLPPPTFDGQNTLPPPRFSGPPPPFNFPGPRGPPPSFAGPPPGHFDGRLPPPSPFPGPRGPPPPQYGDHNSQPAMMENQRGPADHYNKESSGSYQQGMEQHQNHPHMFKDNHAPPPGPAFRGPPPNQYEERRGPPPSGEMGGPRFHPHNQYGDSRSSSPPPHRGSYDDQRGPPSQDSRGPPSQHFGGQDRYRPERHADDLRPVRHSGPLLPTPTEGPIPPSGRIGAHSPEPHREEHWRRHSPDMRRRSGSNREGSEPRGGERPTRFEGGHREREPVPGPPRLPEEAQRERSEDRRRDREREGPHGGRPPWDRDRSHGKRWSRERDRGRERSREKENSRERDRSRGKEGERHREPEGERHRDPEADKRRDRDRDRDRERERGRDREPERRDHDRDRARPRDRDRDRDRERDRERDTRERRRERSRSRDRDRGKDRTRDRERERDKDKEKEKDRDRRERSRSKDKKEDKKEHKHDVSKESDKSVENVNNKNTP
ncbi:death-inducer obliterator 1-like [Aplochiton taeniatus]